MISKNQSLGKKVVGSWLICLFPFWFFSQSDSLQRSIAWSSYVESYIGLNQGRSSTNAQPSFVYSFHREREVSIHLALIKASYSQEHRGRMQQAILMGLTTLLFRI